MIVLAKVKVEVFKNHIYILTYHQFFYYFILMRFLILFPLFQKFLVYPKSSHI